MRFSSIFMHDSGNNSNKQTTERPFLLRIFIRLIQFVLSGSLLAVFAVALTLGGAKFLAWNSVEKYSAGDIPNDSFVVLVDIPVKIDMPNIETHIWPWHRLQELDNKFPGWAFHRGPILSHVKSKHDSYYSKYHGYFTYETEKNKNDTDGIMIEHWISDDTLLYSVYNLENNKIYPVRYQKKASFDYASTAFFPSLLIAFLLVSIINRYFFKKYFPMLSFGG